MIGSLNFCCLTLTYGRIYLKGLERFKHDALLQARGNFDVSVALPLKLRPDLAWWLNNLPGARSPIRRPSFSLKIFSDASSTGWGASCSGQSTGGLWTPDERLLHINVLELIAARFALACFATERQDCDILLRIDNTSALAYINKMGGLQSSSLHQESRLFWQWCEQRRIFVVASYIASAENSDADYASRHFNLDTEWELADSAFKLITKTLAQPVVDLFASRGNAKCTRFFSWFPDPGADAVDAFTQDCGLVGFFWAFPPFALILRTLRKILSDRARGI